MTAIDPTRPDRPISGATARAYTADWHAFTVWCQITGHQALPASPATLEAYLRSEPAAVATLRRRASAINAAHRAAGHAEPARGGPVRQVLHRSGTGRWDHPQIDADRLDQVLKAVPLQGWPTALYGSRDSLLLTLRFRAGLPIRQLTRLTDHDLTLDGDTLRLTPAAGEIVRLSATADPRTCPACSWTRWRWWLSRLLTWTTGALAQQIADGLHQHPPVDEHWCTRIQPRPLRRPTPVFPPLDRWGNLPGVLAAATDSSLGALSRAHLTGTAPAHPARIGGHQADILMTGGQPPTPIVPARLIDPRIPAQVHADGLAARAAAVAMYQQIDDDLTEFDARADELERRIAEAIAASVG